MSASGPSANRIMAQRIISAMPRMPHPVKSPNLDRKVKKFVSKDPNKTKPTQRKKSILDNMETDNAPNLPLDEQSDEENKLLKENNTDVGQDTDKGNPKEKFSTTKHVLVKHKLVRYFKCPVCDIHKTVVLKLNDHFKRRHPPLKCKDCNAVFHTQSSLAHHAYSHLEARYPCSDCDKKFYFAGELKQHCTVHLKTQMHACNYGNCHRWFMNKPNLLKHIRTHTAAPMKCQSYQY